MFENLDKTWKSEFRGIFLGEGSAFLNVERNSKYKEIPMIRAHLTINMRHDEVVFIQSIKTILGVGSIQVIHNSQYSSSGSRDQIRWNTRSPEHIKAILEEILIPGALPCQKVKDFLIILKFCDLRLSLPYLLGETNRQILLDFYYQVFKVHRAIKPSFCYTQE